MLAAAFAYRNCFGIWPQEHILKHVNQEDQPMMHSALYQRFSGAASCLNLTFSLSLKAFQRAARSL